MESSTVQEKLVKPIDLHNNWENPNLKKMRKKLNHKGERSIVRLTLRKSLDELLEDENEG